MKRSNGYLLGIDNGGTATKAALYDIAGNEVAVAGLKTEMLFPHPGFTERNLQQLWTANVRVIAEVLKRSGVDPQSIEAGCGWFLYGNMLRAEYNWELNLKCCIGQGLDSLSIYPFSERINPQGSGISGRRHIYNAVLSETGEKREAQFDIVRDVFSFLEGWEGKLVGAQKLRDVDVGLTSEIHLLSCPERDYAGIFESIAEKRALPFRPDGYGQARQVYDTIGDLSRLFATFNINFNYVDLEDPDSFPSEPRPLIVPNPGYESDGIRSRVVEILRRGMDVIVYPNTLGIDLESLRDIRTEEIPAAGFEPGDIVFRCVDGVGLREVPLHLTLYAFAGVDSSKDTILATYGGKVVAFRRNHEKGSLTVLGFYPQYIQEGSLPFFESILLKEAGINRSVYTEANGAFAAQRRTKTGDFTLITLLNYAGREISTTVHCDSGKDRTTFPRITKLFLPGKSAKCLVCQLDLGQTRMAYCTEELVPCGSPSVYEILPIPRGYYSSPLRKHDGEIAFTSPAEAYIDEQRVGLDRVGGLWIGCFPLGSEKRTLRIE